MHNVVTRLLGTGAVAVAAVLLLPFVFGAQAPGTACITGKINFKGAKPERAVIVIPADKKECKALHEGRPPILDETVIANSTLQNVFVYVSSKELDALTFEPPKTPVVLDQRGCVFSPHVFGLMVGQTLEIRNSDPLMHNLHAFALQNEEFNDAQLAGAKPKQKVFGQVELMLSIKCDVHGWMQAYANVMKHPFFDVSGPRIPVVEITTIEKEKDKDRWLLSGLPAPYGKEVRIAKAGDEYKIEGVPAGLPPFKVLSATDHSFVLEGVKTADWREPGEFILKDLPPGKYELVANHEKFGELKQEITVGDKETKSIDFTYEVK